MTAWISNGCTIAVGDGASPEVFTSIGEVMSIDGPNQSRAAVDTTNLGSTAKTFLAGIEDGGECTFEFHLDPADGAQDTAYTQFTAGTLKNWRIPLTATAPAETITFSAMVMNFNAPKVAIDQVINGAITLKVTGNTTWA